MTDQHSPNPNDLSSPQPDPDDPAHSQDPPSDSDYDSDSSTEAAEAADSNAAVDEALTYLRPGEAIPADDNSPELNVKLFSQVLEGKRVKRRQEDEEKGFVFHEDLFDFPEDPEKWREEDLRELWGNAPLEMTKPGWDPVWADEDDWEVVKEEIKEGRDPPIAPFYVPFRKPYPVIPEDHHDISNPKAVIEELDRIEEFMKWVSYVFPDGSSYEGTVWDDLAHGKGVYVAEAGLVRYEGEWLQNNMESHGVVEIGIPDIEPIPGSKLEEEMRAEGHIISRDYMDPEDREWLEMDIQDSIDLADGEIVTPFYENDDWVKHFGRKPEKGRYRYAGQWKHAGMHGCGVYEVNERTIYGRFYFGELLEDDAGCNEEISALHAGIAEVAAAKARMFVNKPDGMVREERGPYSDPQHPYFYEEDVWMAPGFINQFYEVPDYWKTYVHDVDEEREMWLNSFYKAPLRIPMPAELEYWWANEETPEFVVVNKEPEPDPKDPSKLIYTEDPLILHTPTGRLINYIEDEEHGVRLFWQPTLEEGEEVNPEKAELLPLGYDEFYGLNVGEKNQNFLMRFVSGVENTCRPVFQKLEKWAEEKKKASEVKMKLIEKELELVEAELRLEELIEDMDEELKMKEKEEEKNVETDLLEEATSPVAMVDKKSNQEDEANGDEEEEDDDDDDDDAATSSFGSSSAAKDDTKKGQNGSKPGRSPFSTSSLAFASSSLVSGVPSKLHHLFLAWKESRAMPMTATSLRSEASCFNLKTVDSVSFPPMLVPKVNLKARKQRHLDIQAKITSNRSLSQLRPLSQTSSHHSASMDTKTFPGEMKTRKNTWLHGSPERESDSILSLHTPWYVLEHAVLC